MEGRGTMPKDDPTLQRLNEEFDGVYLSCAPAQKDFVQQLCVDIESRGPHVVDVVKECGVFVAIISEEFLNSKLLMRDFEETVRLKKREMRIIPVFLGVSRPQCRGIHIRLLGVLQDWAKRFDGQEWLGILGVEVNFSTYGFDSYITSEVMYRQRLVDAICKVAPLWVGNHQIVVRFVLSQLEKISSIQNSMEKFRSRVGICSTQCEQLLSRVQRQSRRILHDITLAYLRNSEWSRDFGEYWERNIGALHKFIRNMEAVEDLLYLCAEVDWKLAALSVFLPPPSDPWRNKFALLACESDWAYSYLHLKDPIAEEISPIVKGLIVARNFDQSSVLQKLESGPSKVSHHREMYESLLRKRLQAVALPSTPGSIPDWCWIPGKLDYSIVRVVGSGSSKSVLKCQWLGMDVAIALYTRAHAKRAGNRSRNTG